jgi:hypothetical protein
MRTGGTFVNCYLSDLLSRSRYTVRISWFEGLERDWTEAEMRDFARGGDPTYVHNHVRNWDRPLLQLYHDAGFFIFSFIRPVGDQLCSLYCRARDSGEDLDGITLDGFIQSQVVGETCLDVSFRDWQVPDYWPLFDYIGLFSEVEVIRFLENELGLPWCPETEWAAPVNVTSNLGYRHYCQCGEIRPETQRLVACSVHQRRFEYVRDNAIGQDGME